MTKTNLDDLSDAELVEYFRDWVLTQDDSFADVDKNNRIDDEKLKPCFDTLAARGKESARKLTALTSNPNPNLRLKAAVYAFRAEPDTCRRVLLDLTTRLDIFAVFAWAALSRLDPQAAPPANDLLKNLS